VSGSVAIVTGGAGGIGRATAKILGRDHLVVISGRTRETLDAAVSDLAAQGITAVAVTADVTDRGAVDALFAMAGSLGDVRAVVHCAGVSPKMGTHDYVVAINALGTINVTEAALGIASERFVLVNVASMGGHLLPSFLIPKRAFKHAFNNPAALTAKLVRAAGRMPRNQRSAIAYAFGASFVIWYTAKMAAAFGAKGARILSASLGVIDTEMGQLEKDRAGGLIRDSAFKRLGEPGEIAELLAFCASEKPSYLTGIDILCDGGTKAGVTLRSVIAGARGASPT
jgi:NAD(P)-dependent dehydrogenase (short-subunit alcohol dehydrogenase family)